MPRKYKDGILNGLTYLASSVGIFILLFIIGFVLVRGYQVLSLDFILGTYKAEPTWVKIETTSNTEFKRPIDLDNEIAWSSKWGVGFLETRDQNKKEVLLINYIHVDSPLQNGGIRYTSSSESGRTEDTVSLPEEISITAYFTNFRMPTKHASDLVEYFEQSDSLFIEVTVPAGGIRGSLISTIIMIGITLVIAIPFGICIALYFTEYARKNQVLLILRSMIDMLAGVPSIVYGIVGVLLFFRIFPIGGDKGGYSILGGALTLVAILLPVIIRSTEEALLTVPKELRQGSLALGANQYQTIFKIVLPSALPGILTALLLSIGRIIGESAALILVSGTIINDTPAIREGGATLAVHIWKEMAGEQPNIQVASAISLLIIIIVLVLNLLVKFTTRHLKSID
jgi:phosphate transport system permease protein